MALDTRRIHQFTESDTDTDFSSLLNKLASSVSNAWAYFKGTPAQRNFLTPIPTGAMWQDTDTAARLWKEEGGVWVLWETPWTFVMTIVGGEPRARYRISAGMVEIAGVGTKGNSTYLCFTLPLGSRPTRVLKYQDPSSNARSIEITPAGAVNSSDINAVQVGFGSIRFYPGA